MIKFYSAYKKVHNIDYALGCLFLEIASQYTAAVKEKRKYREQWSKGFDYGLAFASRRSLHSLIKYIRSKQ